MFLRKNIFILKLSGQKGFKMKFFRYFQSKCETFLIFYMKWQECKGVKLTQMIFWEKFCTGVFGQKGVQNDFLHGVTVA